LASLCLVGLQKGRPTPVLVQGGEFVGEVVHVCNAAVETEPAGWGERVCCVSSPALY
jgi:hypothetical protein